LDIDRKPYYFIVTLWGEKYREYFLRLGLASMLAPGNAPSLSCGRENARLLICTTPADWQEMQDDPTFQRAREHLAIEFLELRMPVPEFLRSGFAERRRARHQVVPVTEQDWCEISVTPSELLAPQAFRELKTLAAIINQPLAPSAEYTTRIRFMTWGHKLAAERAFQEKARVVFLGSDMIFADGAFGELERCVARGRKVVLIATLRFAQEPCLDLLRKKNLIAPGQPLAIAPRDLVSLVFPHLHIETICFEFDSAKFSDPATSALWRVPGDDGIVIYNLNYYPILIDFSEATSHEFDPGVTIDGHYIDRNFNHPEDVEVVNDSDRLLYVSFTPQSEYYYSVRNHWLKQIPCISRSYKTYLIRKTLYGWVANNTKRRTYRVPVTFHSKPLTAIWERLVDRTLPIAEQATTAPSRTDRVFAALEGCSVNALTEELHRLRGVYCLRVRNYLIRRGEAHKAAGRNKRAVVNYLAALRFTPYEPMIFSLLFLARMADRDFLGALRDVNVALALAPRDFNLVIQHAEVAQFLGLWEMALADYQAVHSAMPDRADIAAREAGLYAAWGDSLIKDGLPEEALQRYAIGLKRQPGDVNLLSRRVNVKMTLRDYKGALADADEACALAPQDRNLATQRSGVMQVLEAQIAASSLDANTPKLLYSSDK
jgi:tetratricopeptide (TPR) repeat protein